MLRFDSLVIGLGLIGSAATRHLANQGGSVVGVGPAEPVDWSDHTGPYASHYDSGRVTRKLDARLEWAVLASRAIDQYPLIEEQSGLTFHHGCGLAFVRNDPQGIQNQKDVIRHLNLPVKVGTTDAGGDQPFFAFPAGWTTLTEPAPAGYIDPRIMVDAQISSARQAGATILREEALSLERQPDGWQVRTSSQELHAERVLLATGPYLQDLHNMELQASVRPESVVLGQVRADEVDRLSTMASVIYLLDHSELDDVYIVPPTQYPDGEFYIKMGGSHSGVKRVETAEAKRRWMASDDCASLLPLMSDVLQDVLPSVEFLDFRMKPCLITDTASGLPYVDQIGAGLFVAVGGNGHAAKSADAVGALAADLLLNDGAWTDTELEQTSFAARFGSWAPPEGSRHGS